MYLTYINEETKEAFKLNIDKYNDSYFEDVDVNSLNEIFKGMKGIDIKKELKEAKKGLIKEFGKKELADIL